MQGSFYNFYLDLFREKGYGVVYNTHSGTIAAIDRAGTWRALTEGRGSELCDADAAQLINNKMWVESFEQEFADIRNAYERRVDHSKTLYVTMLPTEACNFACPYCFLWEKTPRTMGKQVFDDVLTYVDRRVTEGGEISHIVINWFGGEPTLCLDQICAFMPRLLEAAGSRGISVDGSITTNGYLLTGDALTRLAAAGVRNFQVTVDGMREAHDAGRHLRSGGGTYDVIMRNLSEIHALDSALAFQMDIRCNFTRGTIQAVDGYIDLFMRQFGADSRFKIYCRPVYEYDTKENEVAGMAGDILSLEEGLAQQNRFAEKIESLRGDSNKRRMVDPLPQPTPCWCNAEIENHLIVGADGAVYICDTLIGPDHAVGSLRNGTVSFDRKKNYRYNIFDDPRTEKCMKCRLLPICMGGCLRNRINGEAQCYWTPEGIQETLAHRYG